MFIVVPVVFVIPWNINFLSRLMLSIEPFEKIFALRLRSLEREVSGMDEYIALWYNDLIVVGVA